MRVAIAAALLLGACASGPAVRPTSPGLVLSCTPPEASVSIDEQFIGTARTLQGVVIRLPTGQHRITIERDGFFPYYGEVDLGGVRQSLDVRLVPRPD